MQTSQGQSLLKVATLNTWNGFNDHSTVMLDSLETRAERMARLDRQIAALRQIKPDLLFLQELNPLPFRAHWYAKKLSMRTEYVTCDSGVKMGWGTPGHLNDGLAILFPADWQYQILGSRRLSGGFGFNPIKISASSQPFISFTLRSSRIAYAIRFFIPPEKRIGQYEGRTSLVAAVTQLSSLPAQTPRNEKIIKNALDHGQLNKENVSEIHRSFRTAHARRLNEIDELATWLESLRRTDEPMILGGSFYCEPESPPYNALLRRGWQDLWVEAGNSADLDESATWDAPRNSLAARVINDPVENKMHKDMNDIYRQCRALPQRIDFLFGLAAKSVPSQKHFQLGASGKLGRVSRFGFVTGNPIDAKTIVTDDFTDYKKRNELTSQTSDDNKFISDHHGICAEFSS